VLLHKKRGYKTEKGPTDAGSPQTSKRKTYLIDMPVCHCNHPTCMAFIKRCWSMTSKSTSSNSGPGVRPVGSGGGSFAHALVGAMQGPVASTPMSIGIVPG